MFEDRNSIFFAGFVLGAIFSYSGMMGFFGGCFTGILVVKNYDKIVKPENRSDNKVENKVENKIDWIEIESGQSSQLGQSITSLENIKSIFSNYIKSGKN